MCVLLLFDAVVCVGFDSWCDAVWRVFLCGCVCFVCLCVWCFRLFKVCLCVSSVVDCVMLCGACLFVFVCVCLCRLMRVCVLC